MERLRDLETLTGERGGPLELLGQVYRKLGETKAERITLKKTVANSSDALPALRRLIDLALEDGEWDSVQKYATNVIAINPMLAEGQTALAEAAEQQKGFPEAVRALQALARMDPVDPAAIDFRLARAFKNMGSLDESKHHVLRALLEAPRFREAHALLLELSEMDAPSEDDVGTDEPSAAKEASANRPPPKNAAITARENSDAASAVDTAPQVDTVPEVDTATQADTATQTDTEPQEKDGGLGDRSATEGDARQGGQNLSTEFDPYEGTTE